jgi:glycine C-acetyltransferase
LEKNSEFYGTEDTIFTLRHLTQWRCFWAIIRRRRCDHLDSLNHASIIDGVRLCKGTLSLWKQQYGGFEQQLIKANKAGSRFKIIVTDGVFYGWLWRPIKCDLADNMMPWLWIDECIRRFYRKTARYDG